MLSHCHGTSVSTNIILQLRLLAIQWTEGSVPQASDAKANLKFRLKLTLVNTA